MQNWLKRKFFIWAACLLFIFAAAAGCGGVGEEPGQGTGDGDEAVFSPVPLDLAFASYDELSFDPDVLIITANAEQTEIILRALSYKTGEVWQSKGTTVIGCSWLFIYPYVSGEVNTMITGLYHGMKARRIYPEGQILISVPFDRLQDIVSNLQQIEWVLPQFITGKEEHIQRMQNIAKDLSREIYGE